MSSKWVEAVHATSPAHWWRFGERSGEVKDLVGGFHLPVYGTGNPDWHAEGLITADHNSGVRLDPAISFNRYGLGAGVNFIPPAVAGGQVTVGFWMDKNGVPGTALYLFNSRNQAANTGWQIRLLTTGAFQFMWGTGTAFAADPTPVAATNDKHFWLFAFDESHLVIYRDGVRVREIDIAMVPRGTANPGDMPFSIGPDLRWVGTAKVDAVMDEVLVWPRIITDAEALAMYEAGMEDIDSQRFLEWLPRHIVDDPNVIGVMDAVAREVLRYDNAWTDLFDQLFVQTATWGLRYWEASLMLPVEPADQTMEERRGIVLTTLQAKDAVSGEDFNAAISAITPHYTLEMDWATSTLNVTLNINPDAYTQAQVETILRALIPAHLYYNVQYEAFIAGISTAGDTI